MRISLHGNLERGDFRRVFAYLATELAGRLRQPGKTGMIQEFTFNLQGTSFHIVLSPDTISGTKEVEVPKEAEAASGPVRGDKPKRKFGGGDVSSAGKAASEGTPPVL